MADHSNIEWCDATWNPVAGCSIVSPGCHNCYAAIMAARLEAMGQQKYAGTTKKVNGQVLWTGKINTDDAALSAPLKWRKPKRIFVNSMSDLFHEDVPDGFIMRCLDVMARAWWHTYQILTKRADRMASFFQRWASLEGEDFELKLVRGPEATRKAHPSPRGQLFAAYLESLGAPPPGAAYPTFDWAEGMIGWPSVFPQIWLGVSVEDQQRADKRIPLLLQTPAAVRFLSVEPMLGPVKFDPEWALKYHCSWCDGRIIGSQCMICGREGHERDRIDWVIVGGESGPGARPFNLSWARSLRDQCKAAGVPFFCKQLGGAACDAEAGLAGAALKVPEEALEMVSLRLKDKKGGDMAEWPEDLRVRQFPEVNP